MKPYFEHINIVLQSCCISFTVFLLYVIFDIQLKEYKAYFIVVRGLYGNVVLPPTAYMYVHVAMKALFHFSM